MLVIPKSQPCSSDIFVPTAIEFCAMLVVPRSLNFFSSMTSAANPSRISVALTQAFPNTAPNRVITRVTVANDVVRLICYREVWSPTGSVRVAYTWVVSAFFADIDSALEARETAFVITFDVAHRDFIFPRTKRRATARKRPPSFQSRSVTEVECFQFVKLPPRLHDEGVEMAASKPRVIEVHGAQILSEERKKLVLRADICKVEHDSHR